MNQKIAIKRVLPGVWRVRFGKPEKLTPVHFRSAAPARKGFTLLPPCDAAGLDPETIVFKTTSRGCSLELPMTQEEHIYGLGLNTRLFEMSAGQPYNTPAGRHAFLRPSDSPENDLNESHAPVPFYVSTGGYGVLVDTARYAWFYTGCVEPARGGVPAPGARTMLVDIPSVRGVDVYLFGGPALADAVRRYVLFSGGGCLPPMWGLGVFYRGAGTFTATQSAVMARSFRDQHIPCDAWGLEPGWQSRTYSSSFLWDAGRFPDPDAFMKQMLAMGFHVSFWEHAFVHPDSPIHDALRPWSGDFRVWGGLVPDFATPEARRIFLDHHERLIFGRGGDLIKADECDHQPTSALPWSFPECSTFPSGLDGEQMHSLMGILYQQTMLEPLRRRNRRTWGLVRNSHALAAPLPYVIYSDSYDHRCYVRGLAKQGFAGLQWTPEVRDAASVEEFYRRLQTVIFSPQALINCWYMPNPPWVQINKDIPAPMPDHARVTAVTRGLLELRMSLIPYLYSAFAEYRRTGTPPIRALVMDWPEDPATHSLDDQFMFGPSLLVAPLFAGQTQRTVYLPEGTWHDFRTRRRHEGGRAIEVNTPAEEIAVFVRNNTLLPLARPVEYVAPDTCFELTVHVFGDRPDPFTLWEDDGLTFDYELGQQNRIDLRWVDAMGSQKRTGGYSGSPRYKIVGWTPSTASPSFVL